MRKVVVSRELFSELLRCRGRSEICSPEGVVLGVFESRISDDLELYRWLANEVSSEELEQASRDGGGITTEELMAKLAAIPPVENTQA
jgi:hypothetical protein